MKIRIENSLDWFDSCDYCASQEEGRHYCLLHSCQIKNMDIVRCSDWTAIELDDDFAEALNTVTNKIGKTKSSKERI